ncbi:mevalonate kinase [Granulicatella balaenopterae]|uniref:Mevalonate kinase n=1 Tax=Granulicatella balaenopterae TaxID=137733 RepID=A0A1H9JRB1_9LACT|nr:mevalonate kinase [Granulicatella balaenopterae]SEQ89293.1 mevalonate kinase [Granulicatella balaenopterae]
MKKISRKQAKRTGFGEASGKVILMGEHSVVYQKPAIAMPFCAVKVTAKIIESSDPLNVHCEFYRGLYTKMPEVLESLKHTIYYALKKINDEGISDEFEKTFWIKALKNNQLVQSEVPFTHSPHLTIKIDSTIPAERGMGSSAAVSVAVVRALFDYYQVPLSKETLWEIVQASETIAHGNPSGVDTATTSGTCPIIFKKFQPITPFEIKMKAILIVADTGQTGHTLQAVNMVKALVTSDTPEGKVALQAIETLGDLTVEARDALQTQDASRMGELMNQAHSNLQKLHISNQDLDRLVKAAQSSGALGAKLTGGGLGGCMIALAQDTTSAQKIAQALKNQGASHIWQQQLGE